MKRILFLTLIVALLLIAGCTQSQTSPAARPDATQPPAKDQQPAEMTPAAPSMAAATKAPAVTVTVIRYVAADKAWKDSNLRFAFSAPENWTVTTQQMSLPDGSQGLEYKTNLIPGDVFYIMTFPISRNQDQDYRNAFRKWTPAPGESTVTINSIVFDRFESTFNGETQVGYVARKSSANDLGYSSVIYFITDGSTPFEKDDFEDVVRSFTYLSKETSVTATGYEIPRVR